MAPGGGGVKCHVEDQGAWEASEGCPIDPFFVVGICVGELELAGDQSEA